MKDNKLEIGDVFSWLEHDKTRIATVMKFYSNGSLCKVKVLGQYTPVSFMVDRNATGCTFKIHILPPEEVVMLRLEGKL